MTRAVRGKSCEVSLIARIRVPELTAVQVLKAMGGSLPLATVAWFAPSRLARFALPIALLVFFFAWCVIST